MTQPPHRSTDAPMPARRPLRFSGFSEVADEVRRLRTGRYERAGQWSLEQACRHLDQSMQFAMRPGPHPANTPDQDANWPKFDAIVASGVLPSGIPAPAHVTPPAECDAAAIDGFLETLRRFEAFPGPYGPHRLFGNLTREQVQRLALIHCAHHLSHLVPSAATAAGSTSNG